MSWAKDIPKAYEVTEQEYGIPEGLLFAIALAESGKTHQGQRVAWPWTLNIKGQGKYYDNRAAMETDLLHHVDNTKMIDVGPMQINLRWNGHRVSHPIQVTSLWANLELGAQILLEAYQRKGDWFTAVGAYHSPTPERAETYANRVMKIWGEI